MWVDSPVTSPVTSPVSRLLSPACCVLESVGAASLLLVPRTERLSPQELVKRNLLVLNLAMNDRRTDARCR